MWAKVKKWVVDSVTWAEREMKGKTGVEKKEAVVKKVDALIPLPWFLEWLDGLVIGWLVDKACEKMNWLTDHNFTGNELNDEQSGKLAACLSASVASVADDVKECSTAEKLNALYEKYGVTASDPAETLTPPAAESEYTAALKDAYDATTGDLSPHFSRKEFVCHCGCGAFIHVPELIEKLEKFRELCGNKPLSISCGTRCEKYNKAVSRAAKSQHLHGTAADVKLIPGLTVDQMEKLAEKAGFTGIGKYNWGVHVDVRGTPSRWDYRKKK